KSRRTTVLEPNHGTVAPAMPAETSLQTFLPIGFNGYLLDQVTGCYILGNGYRLYNPEMRAFYSPDSLSLFGAGGISRYQYCNLDPVNLTDPTGHLSWMAWLGIGMGILGIVLSVVTLGASISMLAAGAALTTAGVVAGALGVTSGVLGVASGATGIASGALEASDPEMSAKLGWASLGLGIGSFLTGLGSAGAAAARGAARGMARGRVKTWGGKYAKCHPD
ncbi:RHS repeat-associated core domain-containing protein, partial [Burkholderia ubonensis]|uniref:RHS repeat-associated core domain-containing protein n=1 Tax=Burkholderia ubonensis TaxID=101571 RepID=UPI000A8489D9